MQTAIAVSVRDRQTHSLSLHTVDIITTNCTCLAAIIVHGGPGQMGGTVQQRRLGALWKRQANKNVRFSAISNDIKTDRQRQI